jgi:hypothetical protein
MLSVHLDPSLSEWTHDSPLFIHHQVSKPQMGSVEPTGFGLVGFYRRLNHQRTMEEDAHIESVLNESVQENVQDSEDSDDELETNLYQFDPLKWKVCLGMAHFKGTRPLSDHWIIKEAI